MSDNYDDQELNKTIADLVPTEYPDEVVGSQSEPQEEPQVETEEQVPQEQQSKKHRPLSEEEYLTKYGSMDGYKTPEEWDAYGKVYPEIKSLKEALQTVKQQNDALIESHKRQAENAVKYAREELEQRFKFAKETGDVNEVAKLAEQRAQMDAVSQREVHASQEQEMAKINGIFLDRNKHWYNVNPSYTHEATNLGKNITAANPNLTYAQVVKQVEDMMLYYHPELVVTHRGVPQMSGTRSAINKSAVGVSPQEKQVKSLSQDDKDEYEYIKGTFEKMGIKGRDGKPASYTVQDFLNSKNKVR